MEYGNIYTNTNWGAGSQANGYGSAYPQTPEDND